MTHRRLIVLIACAVLQACHQAPKNAGARPVLDTYTTAEVAADRRALEAAVREGLPSLHKYRTPGEVDSIFAALADSTTGPTSVVDFWRLTAAALSGLRDAHLSVSPSESLAAYVYRAPGRILPVQVAIEGGRLHVLHHYAENDPVEPGAPIRSVNGVPAAQFLAECLRVVPSDGIGSTRGPRKVERDFDDTCGLVAGFPSQYTIEVGDDTGGVRRVIETVPWSERRRLLRATYPDDSVRKAPAELTFRDGGATAIIALRSFSPSGGYDPERFIDTSFARIAANGSSALVIDLRDNTGGADKYAARLFRHVARDTFTYYTRRSLTRRKFEFLKRTDDWTLNYMATGLWIARKLRRAQDGYTLHLAMDRRMKPDKAAYAGKVVVLIGGNSVSTSSEFASVIRARQRGLIVGEESGSSETGGGGAAVSMVLPNTGLVVNIPIVDAFISSPAGGGVSPRGVMPDRVIRVSVRDRLVQRDPVLDSAVAWVRARQ